ncbi:DNA-binding transcriptional LysR family regulator [Hoeflea marina]|uniref:DNA-binding transcriptional LysR family regulator n=1 Tax=Hoeflea marina TaxID=274592 RepID=A0A317PH09_9HYPH|nr:LysR substrate-binding domain-containing protein [Hoeflea marina]PWV99908.1 DNA-binding transcriptional LysR family regulator [Hoeflea marina]
MASDKSLTLHQIEAIRAVMVAGSIGGAARILHVAQPGVSRTIKHVESQLGISLFNRENGRFVPAPEAADVFVQLHAVHKKLGDLDYAVNQLRRGRDVELSIGSVPSIAHAMIPRAIIRFKQRFPDIRLNIELLKIEEAPDYLMLRKGELVCMSHRFDHPAIEFRPLASGRLVCIAARGHPLAGRVSVSAREMADYPLIGIDPKDPYGAIMASIFDATQIQYDINIRARFGSTVIGLVRQDLGIAVLDSFTVADLGADDGHIAVIPIEEKTDFETYVAIRRDVELSGFEDHFIVALRDAMQASNA